MGALDQENIVRVYLNDEVISINGTIVPVNIKQTSLNFTKQYVEKAIIYTATGADIKYIIIEALNGFQEAVFINPTDKDIELFIESIL